MSFFIDKVQAAVVSNAPSTSLIDNINSKIINPLIGLMFVAALIVFLWGTVDFIRNADNAKEREEGKQHMIWGIIGLAIMTSVFGLMSLVVDLLTKVTD